MFYSWEGGTDLGNVIIGERIVLSKFENSLQVGIDPCRHNDAQLLSDGTDSG